MEVLRLENVKSERIRGDRVDGRRSALKARLAGMMEEQRDKDGDQKATGRRGTVSAGRMLLRLGVPEERS